MGSGSSTSNIKPINTAELGQTQETPSCQDSATETTAGRADKSCDGVGRPLPALTNTIVQVMTSPHSLDKSKDGTPISKISQLEKDKKELEDQVVDLQKHVSDLESQNLDLVEQIQILEEQLEKRHADDVAKTDTQCVKTVEAKDQYIQKLEKETKLVQNEISKLKLKYKKKIRSMSSQITEAKHESSLHAFEMSGEVQRLNEENAELLEKIKHLGATKFAEDDGGGGRGSSMKEEEPTAGRTSLILDLSSRVSEQEGQIIELELKIKERDKIIEALKAKKRTDSSKGKRSGSAKSQFSLSSSGATHDLYQDDWSVDGHKEDLHLNNRRPVEHELNDNQYALDVRKKTKRKNCLRERARASRPAAAVMKNVPDTRESSGTSRDSGFDSVNGENMNPTSTRKWIRTGRTDSLNSHLNHDDGIELESVEGTTPGPSTFQTRRSVSPVSEGSRWSDEEPDKEDNVTNLKSNISQSSIRRISAPKKKKKHAGFDSDSFMDNLLRDLDAPLNVASVSGLTETLDRSRVSVSGY